ncbi:MAG TPA: RNA polymerase sigma factor [Candidatus Limnocylindrales bacterium]|nr:RNA polymerase sigma factor [Candidatus Limnocylindrales bacterium]
MTRAKDFEGFYAENFRVLTIQLYAYCGNLTDAQDVVQEACLRALARWPQLSGYEDPAGWVRRVAWNLATSQWRQARRISAWTPGDGQAGQRVEEPTPDRVDLVSALAKLPAPQRRAVVMHYLGDLSVSEIAELSEVPAGTVKSWMARARSVLSEQLSVTDTAAPAAPRAKPSRRGRDVEGFTPEIEPRSLLPTGLGVSVTDPLAGLFDAFAAEVSPQITVPTI